MKCQNSHVTIQPLDFDCPNCGAGADAFGGRGITIQRMERTPLSCKLLHACDKVYCWKCGASETGGSFAALKAREAKGEEEDKEEVNVLNAKDLTGTWVVECHEGLSPAQLSDFLLRYNLVIIHEFSFAAGLFLMRPHPGILLDAAKLRADSAIKRAEPERLEVLVGRMKP